MSEKETKREICYAALAFQTNPKSESSSGALPFKIRNQHNSRKELWSAKSSPSSKAGSVKKIEFNDEEDDTMSALPVRRLPMPPPPRTHSTSLTQTDACEEKDWLKPLLYLGLLLFVCIALIMNMLVWDIYIRNDESSVDDWCIPGTGNFPLLMQSTLTISMPCQLFLRLSHCQANLNM